MTDKLTDLYNRTKETQEPSQPDIATKSDLDRLIEDRQNDPPVPEHNHPAPDWVVNPDNSDRLRMRERENNIQDISERLDNASTKFNRDFDHSR